MTDWSEFSAKSQPDYPEEGQGPPIVALHGFPDTWRTWDRVSSVLVQSGYRVLRLALRGYAPSGIPADHRDDVTAPADDVLSLIDHRGLEEVFILGHDWSASTAYELAHHAPERVSAIVAMAVPPPASTAING